jgi:hypothetical protein
MPCSYRFTPKPYQGSLIVTLIVVGEHPIKDNGNGAERQNEVKPDNRRIDIKPKDDQPSNPHTYAKRAFEEFAAPVDLPKLSADTEWAVVPRN